MKTRKNIALFCAVAMLISLTACNGKKSNEAKSSAETTENKVTEIRNEESKKEGTKDSSASTNGNLDDIAVKDVKESVATLNAEYEGLKTKINTYANYLANADEMETFYAKIYDTNYSLCVGMYEYSLDYAESIIYSDMSNDEKYDALQELYDSIYDDAGGEIYDGIYDGILDDMYDDFYDGLLDDAYDNEEYSEYSEWYEARSNEYEWWYDTRSKVYEDWYDMRSDIYELQLDLRSAVWGDDIEKAEKEISKFKKTADKMSAKQPLPTETTSQPQSAEPAETAAAEIPAEETSVAEAVSDSGAIRPEFKSAMDSYEAFMDEYCAFMKKYSENPSDLGLLADYAEYMKKYADAVKDFEALDNNEMNAAEAAYYVEVSARVSKKLLDAAISA